MRTDRRRSIGRLPGSAPSRMTFAAQLECDGGGGINFGDVGCGYAFVCTACGDRAKFLWQCG